MNIPKRILKLPRRVNIAVVIASLPERPFAAVLKSTTDDLFQHLDGDGQSRPRWFAHQKMNMFRHDYVPVDRQRVPDADVLQRVFERGTSCFLTQKRLASITTEGDEMGITCLLKSL